MPRFLLASSRRAHSTSSSNRHVPPPAAAYAYELIERLGTVRRGLPCFPIPASAVHVLHSPRDFRAVLHDGIASAERRIHLSSLYLGSGPLASSLVSQLVARQQEPSTRCSSVSILVDYHRARRDDDGLALLTQLANAEASRVTLLASPASTAPAFTTKPPLSPPTSKLERLGAVLGEVRGVQHMKLAIFDDDVLLTGANLSDEYLSQRQDRYILFRRVPALADFLARLCDILSSSEEEEGSASRGTISSSMGREVAQHFEAASTAFPPPSIDAMARLEGSWVVPLFQAAAAGLTHETDAVRALLQPSHHHLTLSSPYLNLPEHYVRHLFEGPAHSTPPPPPHADPSPWTARQVTLLTAHPSASGFWGARGPKGLIPHVYTALEAQLSTIASRSTTTTHRLLHFLRRGWTFHGKALWLSPSSPCEGEEAGTPLPTLSLHGSSNLSHRSSERDVELSACLISTSPSVRQALREEQARLLAFTTAADASSTQEDAGWFTKLAARAASVCMRTFL